MLKVFNIWYSMHHRTQRYNDAVPASCPSDVSALWWPANLLFHFSPGYNEIIQDKTRQKMLTIRRVHGAAAERKEYGGHLTADTLA